MKNQKNIQKNKTNQSQKHLEYQIIQIQNAYCIQKFDMYLSEPCKYIATHLLLHIGLAFHYYATFGYLPVSLKIINILLHILSTLSLIVLPFKNPGMIPKIYHEYQKVQLKKIPTKYSTAINRNYPSYNQYITVIKGAILKLKFCQTCNIFRPPRAVHCDICDICIEKFDHHCPWIGGCVAKKNYKYFIFFLTTLTILTLLLLIETIIVTSKYADFNNQLAPTIINIILCLYIFAGFGFVGFLFIFHCILSSNNVTTNQYCKETWQSVSGNPFKKPIIFKNWLKMIVQSYNGKKSNLKDVYYERQAKQIIQNDSIDSINQEKTGINMNQMYLQGNKYDKQQETQKNQIDLYDIKIIIGPKNQNQNKYHQAYHYKETQDINCEQKKYFKYPKSIYEKNENMQNKQQIKKQDKLIKQTKVQQQKQHYKAQFNKIINNKQKKQQVEKKLMMSFDDQSIEQMNKVTKQEISDNYQHKKQIMFLCVDHKIYNLNYISQIQRLKIRFSQNIFQTFSSVQAFKNQLKFIMSSQLGQKLQQGNLIIICICAASFQDKFYQDLQNDKRIKQVCLYCLNQQKAQLLKHNFNKITKAVFQKNQLQNIIEQVNIKYIQKEKKENQQTNKGN